MTSKVTINLIGAKCPEPAVKTIKEALTMPPGTILEILMDSLECLMLISSWTKLLNDQLELLEKEEINENTIKVTIKRK